jgi:hypothetical protein
MKKVEKKKQKLKNFLCFEEEMNDRNRECEEKMKRRSK